MLPVPLLLLLLAVLIPLLLRLPLARPLTRPLPLPLTRPPRPRVLRVLLHLLLHLLRKRLNSMAKGNLFLGYAAGKVGDVVFSRMDGEQVARARNRSPKNPRTALQLLQRVVMKTNSAAYSLMREICDHSFQGLQQGTPNQSRFSMLNVAMLRNRLAEVINSGDAADILNSTEANFASKSSTLAPINAYRISEGTIPSLAVTPSVSGSGASARWLLGLPFNYSFGEGEGFSTLTYAQLVEGLGLQQGDQITLISLTTDDTDGAADAGFFNGFDVQRIILEPASGNMDTTFVVVGDAGYVINDPNPRTTFAGVVSGTAADTGLLLTFAVPTLTYERGSDRSVCASAVIVSRLVGSVWQRSREVLTLRPAGTETAGALQYDYNVNLLGDAVRSYMTEANSTLYLNQAQ